jgi:hypothetical protein
MQKEHIVIINGKTWNSPDDAYKEMGTSDTLFIGTMFGLVWDLHNDVNWPDSPTEEDEEQYSSYFQSCTSRVRHFYNDVDSWLVRETGVNLTAHTHEEQLNALTEYSIITDHPLKKHLISLVSE